MRPSHRCLLRAIAITSTVAVALSSARADAPSDAAVRAAVEKGLRRIEQGADSYITNRQCFACHHQAMAILSMTSARRHGFTVDPDRLREQMEFTLDTFRPKLEQVRKGQGVGGGSTTVGYALATLEAGDHPPDDVSAALVQFLLVRQRPDGSWPPTTNRPPTEGSPFTDAALALRGLRVYGPKDGAGDDDLRTRVETAFTKGKEWLLRNQPTTTEDKVFRLRGLVNAGADPKEVEAARDQLLKEQQEDGSWAQLAELAGDAYATGTVLMALRAAGLAPTDAAYLRGVKYLLGSQREDGAWIVQTRSRPIQVFFDNGDPGGKSQFISFVATNWAVLALLELFPVK